MRQNYETEEAKLLLSANARQIYEGAIRLLHQEFQKSQDPTLWMEAFGYAEKKQSPPLRWK